MGIGQENTIIYVIVFVCSFISFYGRAIPEVLPHILFELNGSSRNVLNLKIVVILYESYSVIIYRAIL